MATNTKIIKFKDGNITYLPVTSADAVQYNNTFNNSVTSVQTAIASNTRDIQQIIQAGKDWNTPSENMLSYIKNKPEPLGGGTPGDGKLVPIPRASETVMVLGSDGQWKTVTAAQTVQISNNLKYCEASSHQNEYIDESLWGSFADPTVATSVFIDDINISLT